MDHIIAFRRRWVWVLYLSKPHSYSCSYNKHTYVVCCLQSAVKGQQKREEGRSDDVTDSDDDREIYSSSTDEDEINAIYWLCVTFSLSRVILSLPAKGLSLYIYSGSNIWIDPYHPIKLLHKNYGGCNMAFLPLLLHEDESYAAILVEKWPLIQFIPHRKLCRLIRRYSSFLSKCTSVYY